MKITLGVLVCLAVGGGPALADVTTIDGLGNAFHSDCGPVGCEREYQEVSGPSLFPGPFTITAPTVFNQSFEPDASAGAPVTTLTERGISQALDTKDLDTLRADVQKLQNSNASLMRHPVVAALMGASVGVLGSLIIFVVIASRTERRRQAVQLLNQFVAGEFYIKARLITQEYLLPNGAKYSRTINARREPLDFVTVSVELGKSGDPTDKEARFYIRAIPSFFWLVEQAMKKGYVDKRETVFDYHYAWYWVHVISHRIKGCKDNRMFRAMSWLDKTAIGEVLPEFNRLLADLPLGVTFPKYDPSAED